MSAGSRWSSMAVAVAPAIFLKVVLGAVLILLRSRPSREPVGESSQSLVEDG